MDKQTAIDLLDNLLGMVEDNHESDYDTAIKMGIDALKEKAQLSEEDATKDATFDCISRQAVINEMKDMYTAAEEWAQGAHDDDTRARAESCMATNVELKLRVEKLPSVHPDFDAYCDRLWKLAYERGKRDAQPQRWIPVTERLPDDGVEVWVTIKGHDVIRCEEGETLEQAIDRINKIRWVTRGYWSDEEHGWNDPSFGCPLMVQPIAWMPMEVPEPYKGGQDDT